MLYAFYYIHVSLFVNGSFYNFFIFLFFFTFNVNLIIVIINDN